MRKILWGFAACGFLLLVGVVAVAHHAARYPHSFVGRVLHGASYAASRMNPTVGFSSVLAKLQHEEKPDEVQGIPDEPVPTEDPVAETVVMDAAPIVIPEDDTPVKNDVPGTALLELPPETPVASTYGAETECPRPTCPTAPLVMPLCHDEEQCEVLGPPTVEKDSYELLPMPEVEAEAEKLPMPRVETEEQPVGWNWLEMSWPMCWIRMIQSWTKPVAVSDEKPVAEEPCQPQPCVDPHYHHHHSSCPYTGRCYPMPGSGCPGSTPSCDPPKPDGVEEESEEKSEAVPPTALRKIRRFKTREAIDSVSPAQPGVDTMEFRPSDRQLHDYGPGPL